MEKKNVLRLIFALIFIALSLVWQIVCLIFEIKWTINIWIQTPFFIIMLIIFIFSGAFTKEERDSPEEKTRYLTEQQAQDYLNRKISRNPNNPINLLWETITISGTVNDPQSEGRVYYANPRDRKGKRHLIAVRVDGKNYETQIAIETLSNTLTRKEQLEILEYRANKLFPSPAQSGYETEEFIDQSTGGVVRRRTTKNIIQKKKEEPLAPNKEEKEGEDK